MSPVTRCSSEWHRPEAASSTCTSPALGSSRSMSSTLHSSVLLPQDGGRDSTSHSSYPAATRGAVGRLSSILPQGQNGRASCRPAWSVGSAAALRHLPGRTAVTHHILAIDLGTGGPKVALVDEHGKVVAHEVETNGVILEPHGGAEQDPDEWWDAITRAVHRLVAAAPEEAAALAGVSVTSQWCGTVPVGGDGKAIGNAIIWMDSRGADAIGKVVSGRVNVMGYDPRRLAALGAAHRRRPQPQRQGLDRPHPLAQGGAARGLRRRRAAARAGRLPQLPPHGEGGVVARLHRHALAHRQPRPRRHHLPPAAPGVDRGRQGQAAPAGAVGLGGGRAARRPWPRSGASPPGCR